jgi:hypothetical protein
MDSPTGSPTLRPTLTPELKLTGLLAQRGAVMLVVT